MEIKPLFGVSYELFFQLFNTVILILFLVLIFKGIRYLVSKIKGSKSQENRIKELENRVKELEEKDSLL